MASRLLLLALALLLLPTVQAASGLLHSSAAEAEGPGTVRSALMGGELRNATSAEGLALTVARGRLVVYEERQELWAAQVGITPSEHRRWEEELAGAAIDRFQLGPGARLLLLADGLGLEGPADGLRLTAAPTGIRTHAPHASVSEPDWSIDARRALQTVPPPGHVASGPFRLVVWSASFTLSNATGEHRVEAGAANEPAAGAAPAYRHTQRELVIEVDEGLIGLGQAPFRLFLAAAAIDLAGGHLDLVAPIGTHPVDGSPLASGTRRLRLDGPLEADLAKTDGAVVATFPRPPGTAGGVAGVGPAGAAAWPWALAALVLLPIALAGGSRIRLGVRLRRLDRLVRSRRFGQALELARAIRRRRPRHPDALVAESMALLRERRYREAGAVLEADGWTLALGPLRDCLRATAAAGEGRVEDAARWLDACLRDAPDLEAEVAAHPLLAPLLRRGAGSGGRRAGHAA